MGEPDVIVRDTLVNNVFCEIDYGQSVAYSWSALIESSWLGGTVWTAVTPGGYSLVTRFSEYLTGGFRTLERVNNGRTLQVGTSR